MLGVVPLAYSVHVKACYGLSLILLGISPIVDSQIQCYVTCIYYLWKEKWIIGRPGKLSDITQRNNQHAKIANRKEDLHIIINI